MKVDRVVPSGHTRGGTRGGNPLLVKDGTTPGTTSSSTRESSLTQDWSISETRGGKRSGSEPRLDRDLWTRHPGGVSIEGDRRGKAGPLLKSGNLHVCFWNTFVPTRGSEYLCLVCSRPYSTPGRGCPGPSGPGS